MSAERRGQGDDKQTNRRTDGRTDRQTEREGEREREIERERGRERDKRLPTCSAVQITNRVTNGVLCKAPQQEVVLKSKRARNCPLKTTQ